MWLTKKNNVGSFITYFLGVKSFQHVSDKLTVIEVNFVLNFTVSGSIDLTPENVTISR